MPERNENTQKLAHSDSNIIHNSEIVEITVHQLMNKENMVYPYSGKL